MYFFIQKDNGAKKPIKASNVAELIDKANTAFNIDMNITETKLVFRDPTNEQQNAS